MILLGGYDGQPRDNILKFDINKREWTEVGNMKYAAMRIGVSEVNLTDFQSWC